VRQTTRRKYYGRINVAQAISSALKDLDNAIEESKKPPAESPLATALRRAGKSLMEAAEACDTYGMGRKRLTSALEREKAHIAAMLDQVKAIPVFQEEKAAAKRKHPEVK